MADINSIVVKAGDTLSEIAEKYFKDFGYSGTYEFVNVLTKLNNLKDPDVLVVGQEIKLSGEPSSTTPTTAGQARIDLFGLQSNTDRTIYATWTWSKDNTENYETKWYYATGDNIWFVGNSSTTEETQSLYNAPSNATKVKFKVKPVSKKHKVNDTDVDYWTAKWSDAKTYNFSDNPPTKPGVPNVEIKEFVLTATLDNLDVNGDTIQFQVVKNNSSVFNTGPVTIKTGHVTYTCKIDPGGEYKVRCRSVRGDLYSDWTEYSDNKGTIPEAPDGITELKALSETSVRVDWTGVTNAESYVVEYTTQKRYFDSSNETSSITIANDMTHAEVTGLETGQEYFFRLRAVNKEGESAWTEPLSITIGKNPAAPTTWSSTTTAITGEALTLYWVHNAEDGSSQTYADLELYINGVKYSYVIENTTDEEEKDKTSSYAISTSGYSEGTSIQWRVRTAGITKTYGDWSVQRTITVYAPPTLSLNVTDSQGSLVYTLTSFPLKVYAVAGPKTQAPVGYHLDIIANESYETVDTIGNPKTVSKGDAVYSRSFDISSSLSTTISASDVDLENNVGYTVKCMVSMNSGLKAESSSTFTVSWTDEQYEPNAEIGVDMDAYTASIMPYCVDVDGNRIPNILLSVYRREFDGGFTELATGIDNATSTFITDPHPALDYARYRIVATSTVTGAVSYYDAPGYPIGGIDVIIQWAEEWTDYNVMNDEAGDAFEQSPWTGSMLKLRYNIDVSENNTSDVVLIKYAGRKHPVSYYGTQIGYKATWNTTIDAKDIETLYALRRLQQWMGDVYVREPSGSGYWANIKVSFSQKHSDVTIPVTFDITRVEGGA